MSGLKLTSCKGVCSRTELDNRAIGIQDDIINCIPSKFCYIVDKHLDNKNREALEKHKEDLPVYIIQAHGVYEIGTKLEGNKITIDDTDVIKVPEDTYIVDTTPLTSSQLACNNDNININSISQNPNKFKNDIFSEDYFNVFSYSSNIRKGPMIGEGRYFASRPILGVPNYSFIDKGFDFYDNEEAYTWNTGVFQACEKTKDLKLKYKVHVPNHSQDDKLSRLFNLDDDENLNIFDYENNPDILRKAAILADIIRNSVIEKKKVCLRQIIETLGKGVYVFFTCSSSTVYLNGNEISDTINELQNSFEHIPPDDIDKMTKTTKYMFFLEEYKTLIDNTIMEIFNNLRFAWNNMVVGNRVDRIAKRTQRKVRLTPRDVELEFPQANVDSLVTIKSMLKELDQQSSVKKSIKSTPRTKTKTITKTRTRTTTKRGGKKSRKPRKSRKIIK